MALPEVAVLVVAAQVVLAAQLLLLELQTLAAVAAGEDLAETQVLLLAQAAPAS